MATSKYTPEFPYSKDQAIVSSGRVVLHAQDDSIMLFGNKSIALSSLGTVNLDIAERLCISAPKIELGLNAETVGDPVVLGNKYKEMMIDLLSKLQRLSNALTRFNESESEVAVSGIVNSSATLASTCARIQANINTLLSDVTYSL